MINSIKTKAKVKADEIDASLLFDHEKQLKVMNKGEVGRMHYSNISMLLILAVREYLDAWLNM